MRSASKAASPPGERLNKPAVPRILQLEIERRTIMFLRKTRTALAATIMTLAVVFAASSGGWLVAPAQAGITATGVD